MYILALDSSAGLACAALLSDRTLLHEVRDLSGHAHSVTLLPMIVSMLEKHGLRPHDLNLFACSVGPGSYTGVRIGVATVKGLASGSGIPCLPLSSLEVLAQNGRGSGHLICPVIDARRDRVYTALFEERDGIIQRLTPDMAATLSFLDALLKKRGRVTSLVGDGTEKALSGLTYSKIRALPEQLRDTCPYNAGLLAYERYTADPGCAVGEERLSPVYLGQTQAERERAEKMKMN